ncbi:MAG: HEAT repeat domain-containing protein [Vicinamibacterales bacterium]
MAHDRTVHPAVRGLLDHASPEVRRHAIALLSRANDLTVRDRVQDLLRDPDLEVRTEALLYLSEHSNVDPLERLESVGDFEDFSIRASMVAFLARPGRAQNLEAAGLMLQKMVDEPGTEGAAPGWRPPASSASSRTGSTTSSVHSWPTRMWRWPGRRSWPPDGSASGCWWAG